MWSTDILVITYPPYIRFCDVILNLSANICYTCGRNHWLLSVSLVGTPTGSRITLRIKSNNVLNKLILLTVSSCSIVTIENSKRIQSIVIELI